VVLVYVLLVLVGAATAIFTVQNTDPVVIRFVGWRVEGMPLALVVLLSLLVGLFLGSTVGVIQQLRLRSRIRQLERMPPPPVPPPPAPPPPSLS
jgi:uncharacterized integral membrane protein